MLSGVQIKRTFCSCFQNWRGSLMQLSPSLGWMLDHLGENELATAGVTPNLTRSVYWQLEAPKPWLPPSEWLTSLVKQKKKRGIFSPLLLVWYNGWDALCFFYYTWWHIRCTSIIHCTINLDWNHNSESLKQCAYMQSVRRMTCHGLALSKIDTAVNPKFIVPHSWLGKCLVHLPWFHFPLNDLEVHL